MAARAGTSSPPGPRPRHATSTANSRPTRTPVTRGPQSLSKWDGASGAAECVDVVKGLWDSWEEDAFAFDKEAGRFFDEAKMHVLGHKGKFFAVRGPLNVACLPQGHPVVVQAGASEHGRELAAATADLVYAVHSTRETARAFYADVKGRLGKYGRAVDDRKILPALRPIVGSTAAEAQAKFNELQELLDPVVGFARLNHTFGDLSGYPLDGPVPLDKLGPAELRSISAQLLERVKRQNPTIRQLYGEVAGRGGFCVIGTASEIADVIEDWFAHDACDGFNITPTHLPGGCQDFVEMVTPELQRRGLFRTEYEGTTLRENLGLKRPVNRYAAERRA